MIGIVECFAILYLKSKPYKPRSHHVGFPDDNRVLEIQKNKIALKDPDIPEEMKAYMTRLSETL